MALLSGWLAGCSLDQRYVYYPTPWEPGDWAAASGLPLEDVRFAAADGTRLHGWMVPTTADAPVLLWCHGNAGNIIDRLDVLKPFVQQGIASLMFEYRGYGQSQGRPTERGLYDDALAAYDLLRSRGIPPERIVLYGQSLGAAVCSELALQRPAAGLILETPFTSIADMARRYYGPLPVYLLLEARYDVLSRVPRLRLPLLVIHGDEDSIVPIAMGRRVFEAAPEPKTWLLVPGADHNNLAFVGGARYQQALLDFIRRVTASGAV